MVEVRTPSSQYSFEIIVLGNALVVMTVYRDSKLRSQRQNWLIVSLACADLLVGLIVMPITLAYEIADRWILGNRPNRKCDLRKFLEISRKVRVRNVAGTGCPLRDRVHPSHLCHFPGQVGRLAECLSD